MADNQGAKISCDHFGKRLRKLRLTIRVLKFHVITWQKGLGQV